eukprot:scaffold15302_cov58-Phaeocystis_antarctica.AAC.1
MIWSCGSARTSLSTRARRSSRMILMGDAAASSPSSVSPSSVGSQAKNTMTTSKTFQPERRNRHGLRSSAITLPHLDDDLDREDDGNALVEVTDHRRRGVLRVGLETGEASGEEDGDSHSVGEPSLMRYRAAEARWPVDVPMHETVDLLFRAVVLLLTDAAPQSEHLVALAAL